MSNISSVTISNSRPRYYEIPVTTNVNSTMHADIVQLQFLGALQDKNPTQFMVGISLANGISIGQPTVNRADSSKVDLDVTGTYIEGSGSTYFGIINANAGDVEIEFSLKVNGDIVNYTFKKRKDKVV